VYISEGTKKKKRKKKKKSKNPSRIQNKIN